MLSSSRKSDWVFVVDLPIEFATCGCTLESSPLLEQERDVICCALVSDRANPVHPIDASCPFAGACPVNQTSTIPDIWIHEVSSRFTAHNYPSDSAERAELYWRQHRFDRQEPDCSVDLLQQLDALVCSLLILSRNTEPQIRWQRSGAEVFNSTSRALGKRLECMPWALANDCQDAIAILVGDFIEEDVAHRVDKDQFRPLEFARFIELVRFHDDVKASRKRKRSTLIFGKFASVTMRAPWADRCASADRIPCLFGPDDFSHIHFCTSKKQCNTHVASILVNST